MLKRGLQNLDRTTPHVNIFKLVMGVFISGEDISRRDILIIGHVIVNVGGINSIHWSQVLTNAIFYICFTIALYQSISLSHHFNFSPLFHNFTGKRHKKAALEQQAIELFGSCGSDEGDIE